MDSCATPQKFDEMEDYLRRAKEMNKNNGLQGYLVVFQRVTSDGQIEVCKEVCTFPSFSHIAAIYDHPEKGISVLDTKYMGVGKTALKELAHRAVADITEDIAKHGNRTGT